MKKRTGYFTKLVLFLSVLLIASFLLGAYLLRSSNKNETKTITREEILMSSVEEIERLYSTSYISEIPAIKTKRGMFSDESIVIIYRVTIKAGIDMSYFGEDDMRVSGDSIELTLPPAEILLVQCNPMDTKCFHGSSSFSEKEITSMYREALANAKEQAEEDGIIERATEQSEQLLKAFLSSLGYKYISITINQ